MHESLGVYCKDIINHLVYENFPAGVLSLRKFFIAILSVFLYNTRQRAKRKCIKREDNYRFGFGKE